MSDDMALAYLHQASSLHEAIFTITARQRTEKNPQRAALMELAKQILVEERDIALKLIIHYGMGGEKRD